MTGAREEDIRRVEEKAGARLPDWLRERLRRENGFTLDDGAGVTARSWRILPVLDRTDRHRMTATAHDMLHHTTIARAVDRVSTPGFGEPEPGHPFPADGLVIGLGGSDVERLVLLPDPDDLGTFGPALHRQMQFAPIHALGVRLDAFAPDPLSFDTGEPLPVFRYHPDPIATGSVVRSGRTCGSCGRQRGWVVRDRGGEALCPWCLASGAAEDAALADFWRAELADVPASVALEVGMRTPGFLTWQDPVWLTHCGDAAAFVGPAGWEQMKEHPDACDMLVDDGWPREYLEDLDADGDATAYLFRCLHCGAHLAFADAS